MIQTTMRLPASYYQQFDADYKLDVPAEAYGGWKQAEIEIAPQSTAVVVMHAWDAGTFGDYPGWHRAVEFLARASEICRTIFPPLLGAVRESGFNLFHVVGGGPYYHDYPGYRRAVSMAEPEPEPPAQIASDPALDNLRQFRADRVFVGPHNREDVERGFARLDFPAEARPHGDEGIAESGNQLFALCREAGVNHLIYAGFAVNWCMLLSTGGMADMAPRGLMCSVLRQAVTAVENKETARSEAGKENALWRIGFNYGFVFEVDDFIAALQRSSE